MGQSTQARETDEQRQGETDSAYGTAAEAAFLRSACVSLVLQRPNVDLTLVAALYKAGFADGCNYGAAESRIMFEKVLASLASGTPQ